MKLYIGQLVEVGGNLLNDECTLGRIQEMDSRDPAVNAFYEKVELLNGDKFYVFRDNIIPKVEAGPGLAP